MSSIVFTTGATVTFRALLAHVTTVLFLSGLRDGGFAHVTIQYGNETDRSHRHVSKAYFSELLAANGVVEKLDLSIANEFNDKSVTTFQTKGLTLTVFAFSPTIGEHIQHADVVVSHAGTGSILDTLRLRKPLIVVTNDALMDDHQKDVADQLAKDNYLAQISVADLGQLMGLIAEVNSGKRTFSELPPANTGVIQQIVLEELRR